MTKKQNPGQLARLQDNWKRLTRGAEGAIKRLREGRLSAPYHSHYKQVLQQDQCELRHYTPGAEASESLLLVSSPLMPADIFDIAPELSAIQWLQEHNLDVWLVTLGDPTQALAPNQQELLQTASQALDRMVQSVKAPVHLLGYSQGGILAYQLAAFRKSQDIASVITMGAPLSPAQHQAGVTSVTKKLASFVWRGLRNTSAPKEGEAGEPTQQDWLPTPYQAKHLFKLTGLLPADATQEAPSPSPKRWLISPIRGLIEQVWSPSTGATSPIGTGKLSDITCPVLVFSGIHDSVATKEAVQAIQSHLKEDQVELVEAETGHFGLLVGAEAMQTIWPQVVQWMEWHASDSEMGFQAFRDSQQAESPSEESEGIEPEETSETTATQGSATPPQTNTQALVKRGQETTPPWGLRLPVQRLYDLATDMVDQLWQRLEDASTDVGVMVEAMRWQLPRLARLLSLTDDAKVSLSLALEEQAKALPDEPYLFWKGEQWSFSQVHLAVDLLALELQGLGIRPQSHVWVAMESTPAQVLVLLAINRLRAVAMLAPQSPLPEEDLEHLFSQSDPMLVLANGSGHTELLSFAAQPEWSCDLVWVEPTNTIAPPQTRHKLTLERPSPQSEETSPFNNQGFAGDDALWVWTAGTTGPPKLVQINNKRWSVAALGAAAACGLTSKDRILCPLPLTHATGAMLALGGSLLGGASLVLAPPTPSTLLHQLRHTEASVLLLAGDIGARFGPLLRRHRATDFPSLRLIAGNGWGQEDLTHWRSWDPYKAFQVVQFFAMSEGNFALVNLDPVSPKSVGRPLLGQEELQLIAFDLDKQEPKAKEPGRLLPSLPGRPGVMVSRFQDDTSPTLYGPPTSSLEVENWLKPRVLMDLFEDGDRWLWTAELFTCDPEGDFSYIGRLGETITDHTEEPITYLSRDDVRRAIQALPEVALCQLIPDQGATMGLIELRPGAIFVPETCYQTLRMTLPQHTLPTWFRVVQALPTVLTLDALKQQALHHHNQGTEWLYACDHEQQTYTLTTAH